MTVKPRAAPLPSDLEPQLATLVDEVPTGGEWLHEIKLDGYRLLARVDHGQVSLVTRRGNDWSARLPATIAALAELPAERVLLDGELVVLNERGISDFQLLQNALSDAQQAGLCYYAFDLLHLDGVSLLDRPLDERKAALAALLRRASKPVRARVRLSDHVVGDGAAFFANACAMGLEGIISKRRDRPYRPGRGGDWLKIKCTHRQEFAVGGFSAPRGSRSHFGALLLGYYDDTGHLRYAGKVGTGFTARSLQEVHERLTPLVQPKPAFVDPPRGAEARDVCWIRPSLLAEIEFTEITRDGKIRHPSFRGLRDDKPGRAARLERPVAAAAAAEPTSRRRRPPARRR